MKGSFCCLNRLMIMNISVSIWILSAFITSAVCEEDYHTINTTNISWFTVYIPVTNLNLTEVSHLRFNVKACNDAHLNLLPTNVNNTYEIVIGGWSNNKSVIRQYNKNTGVKHNRTALVLTFGYLDCNSFRPFWISWDGGHIKVGRGNQVGNSSTVFMNWLDPSPYPIATVSVSTGWGSTGSWQIYSPLNALSTTAANYGPTTSANNTTQTPDMQLPDLTVILGIAGGAVFIIIMVIIIACYCTRFKNRRRPLSLQTDSQKNPSNASMIYRNLIENVNNSSTKNPPTTSRSSDDLLQETITDEREKSSETIEKNKKEVNYNKYSKDSAKGNIAFDKTESTSGTMEKNKKKIALLPLNIHPKYSSNDLSTENIKSEEIDASNALTEVQSPATPNTPDTPSYEYVHVDPKAKPLGSRNITHSYITVHSDNHEKVDPKSQSLELSDNTNEYLTIYTDEQAEAAKKRQGGDKTNMLPPNQSTKGEARNYCNTENRNGELVDVYISPANDGYYSNGDPHNTYYNEGQQPNVEHYTNSKLEPVDAHYYNAIDPHDKETSEQPGYYNISETQQNDYYNTENENQQGNTQQDYYNDMKTEQPGYYNCDGIKTESRPNSDVGEDYDYCDVDKPTSLIKA